MVASESYDRDSASLSVSLFDLSELRADRERGLTLAIGAASLACLSVGV